MWAKEVGGKGRPRPLRPPASADSPPLCATNTCLIFFVLHRVATLAKYVTEKHRSSARKLKVRKLREDSSTGTNSSGEQDGECDEAKADACVPSELLNVTMDGGEDFWTQDMCKKLVDMVECWELEDCCHRGATGYEMAFEVCQKTVPDAKNPCQEGDKDDEDDEDDEDEKEKGCKEDMCSMQVHELKAFLNETSRRNLTDDDMTSICLMGLGVETCFKNTSCCGEETMNPVAEHDIDMWKMCEGGGYRYAKICHEGPADWDMCDEKKLEMCKPLIDMSIAFVNGTNLTSLDSDQSRYYCVLFDSVEACLFSAGCCENAGRYFPESMHNLSAAQYCEAPDYLYTGVCREDPRLPPKDPHEETCEEKLKDCNHYVATLGSMVNKSTTAAGITTGNDTDQMKDWCYFAFTIESCFAAAGCCTEGGNRVPMYLREMDFTEICHSAGYNYSQGMICSHAMDSKDHEDHGDEEGKEDSKEDDENHRDEDDEDHEDHPPHHGEHCNQTTLCDPFFNDLSAYLAAGARMGLDNQKLCVMSIAVEGCFAQSMCCGKTRELHALESQYSLDFGEICENATFKRPKMCEDEKDHDGPMCNRTGVMQCNASIANAVAMNVMSNASNMSSQEMEARCMAARDVEACISEYSCCHEAEKIIPEELMKVDIRELCDIPGQNYTPLCDGEGDDHDDHEDRCGRCNPPLHDLEHMLSMMNVSSASMMELELVCLMSVNVDSCFAKTHCCEKRPSLLSLTTRDGTMADFDGICKSAGYWRPSVCSVLWPDDKDKDDGDKDDKDDKDDKEQCNHTLVEACNGLIYELNYSYQRMTLGRCPRYGFETHAEARARQQECFCACYAKSAAVLEALLDLDIEVSCSQVGMNQTAYCPRDEEDGEDDRESRCDRPAYDTCGDAAQELADIVNRSGLIVRKPPHKPNMTNTTHSDHTSTDHTDMPMPEIDMMVLKNMSVDELGQICLARAPELLRHAVTRSFVAAWKSYLFRP
ncbi:unnamed protein product [Symbiodinium natans]|uniref:Uncharacterized protein n=1 Tax=Symbiodinium natans TaxID=878477 RepID=A0A812IPE8_9DINO|nr:unnamed protein product [Symbiodinium natans]